MLGLGPVKRSLVLALVLGGSLVAVLPAAGQGLPGLWQSLPGPAKVRQEVAYMQVAGKLHLAGGSADQQAFDPQTGAWTALAPLPRKLDHIQAVALGGKIYYVGGLASWPAGHVGSVHVYDVATNTFSEGAAMPAGRERGAGGVAVHDGRIYYAGGLHAGSAVDWFDVYDPGTDEWTELPDMPRERDHFHAAAIGGRFYAIGGRDTGINSTTAANDAFDLAPGGGWSTGLDALPTPRGGFAAAVIGREIFVIGGEGGNRTYDTVEAYDTVADSWRPLAPMPTARHGIQAATCNGGIYIAAGGTTQGGANPTNVHEVFFPGGVATPCTPETAAATPPSGGAPAPAASGEPAAESTAGGPAAGGAPVAAADRTPPVVRELRARASIGSARVRVRLELTEAATVTLALQRARAGRRVDGACRPLTRRTRGNRPCTRHVSAGARTQRAATAGWSRFELATARLRSGRYRLVARATDAAGNRSAAERTAFRPTATR